MAVVAGIVVAAGIGERLGGDVPKAFVTVAGATLLARAVLGMRAGGVTSLVAVVPDGFEQDAQAEVGPDVVVVAGGATRTASVAAGLAHVDDDVDVVAVHDAARALVPADVVARVVAAVVDGVGTDEVVDGRRDRGRGGNAPVVAAAPGLAVADTLKRVDEDDTVVATVARAGLVGIQTPQVFRRTALAAAHAAAARRGAAATDDLALVEALLAEGTLTGRVVVTQGSPMALKVTRPEDLAVAAALAAESEPPSGHRTSFPGPLHGASSTSARTRS